MHLKSVIRQTSFIYSLKVISVIISLLLTSLLVRNLTVSEYGLFSLWFSFFSITAAILTFGLGEFTLKSVIGLPQVPFRNQFAVLVGFVFRLIFIEFIFLLGIFLGLKNLLQITFIDYIIVSASIVLAVLVSVLFAYFQAKKKPYLSVLLAFLTTQGYFFPLLFLFKIGLFNLKTIFLSFLLMYFLVSFFLIFFFFKKNVISANYLFLRKKNLVKDIFSFSAPVTLYLAFGFLLSGADRFIISHYLSLESVATYSLAYTLVSFLPVLYLVILKTINPFFLDEVKKEKTKQNLYWFNIMSLFSLLIVIPGMFGLVFFRKQLFLLIGSTNYVGSEYLVLFLVPFVLFSLVQHLSFRIAVASDDLKFLMKLLFGGLLVNLILNFLFIPSFGLIAAALATVFAYFLIALISILRYKKYFAFALQRFHKILLSGLGMYIFLSFLPLFDLYYYDFVFIPLAGGVFLILIFLFKVFSRAELNEIRKLLFSKPFEK